MHSHSGRPRSLPWSEPRAGNFRSACLQEHRPAPRASGRRANRGPRAHGKACLSALTWRCIEVRHCSGCIRQPREAREANVAKQRKLVVPIIKGLQASGISTLTGLAAALNERGIQTPQGRRWTP